MCYCDPRIRTMSCGKTRCVPKSMLVVNQTDSRPMIDQTMAVAPGHHTRDDHPGWRKPSLPLKEVVEAIQITMQPSAARDWLIRHLTERAR